jgi:magnesium transporter
MVIEKQMLDEIRELIENRDFAALRKLGEDFAPADIAEIFSESDEEDLLILFRLLPKDTAAECFVEMDTDVQQSLIEALSDKELTEIVDDLFLDDAVDIIEEMPANMVKRILENTNPETRARINQLLKYPKDSAGSIMTVEFVELRARMTVADAFERIRATGLDKETVYTCYVTDDRRALIGIVTVKDMLLAGNDAVVGDIMTTTIISVTTTTDKEETAKTLAKYDLMALPVVDNESRLVGIVTVDDAIDVIKEEDTEDIELMAAILPSDKPYLKTSVFEIWRKRIPWLLLLMVSATFTSRILLSFEDALSHWVILTAFIPMIMDTGGNAGGQASATIIRGLSLGDIEMRDILRVIFKEVRVAAMCGVTLAIVNFAKITLLHEATWQPALVVSATLALAVVIAKIVGCSLPIIAKRIGFDPAVMASPFITTIVDALSLLVYFGIATTVLPMGG